MRMVYVLFLAFLASSCNKQISVEEKAEPLVKIQAPTKKAKPKIPPPDIEIKKNLKNIQIQQKEINLRLERLDHKIKMKKEKRKVKVNPTCRGRTCAGDKSK